MLTKIIIAIATAAILVIIVIAIDILKPRFCKSCGTKMNRFFDFEEDAEVYQCPQCGRSYLIK